MLLLPVLILEYGLGQGGGGVEGGFEIDTQAARHGSQLTGRILGKIEDFASSISGVGTADAIDGGPVWCG